MLTPYECITRIKKIKYKNVGLDVEYNVEIVNGILTVTFLGSNSKSDYKHDLMAWQNLYKIGDEKFLIHHGFLKLWKSAKDEVIKDIKELLTDNMPIQIIGHSMGSAIGQLCYLELYKMNIKNIQLTIFATPRTFGIFKHWKLKKIFKNTKNFRNGSDAVSHLPPRIFGYAHVQPLIKIGKSDFPFLIGIFQVGKRHDTPYYIKTFNEILN